MLKQGRYWLWWLRNKLFDRYYWSQSRDEMRGLIQTIETPDELLNLSHVYRGHGFYYSINANQHPEEICQLFERVQALDPKVIVEIGTRAGGTLFLWSQASPKLELLASIDLPGGIHGGGYVVEREKLYRLFTENQPNCRLELLRCDSQHESTKQRLKQLLHKRPIDFLFIDGDHRYAGVKRDYALYHDLMCDGGIIAFHDIYPNTRDSSIQVDQFWNELRDDEHLSTEEIVHKPYTGRYGIGMILVHKQPTKEA